jgi:hypothetical protein
MYLYPKYKYNDEVNQDEIGRACSMHGESNSYRILVGKSERKTPLGRPRYRWENKIKMDLRETDGDDMD